MVERVNRAIVALLGGGLVIVSGVLDQRQAVAGIDFNTIALLTGMMLLVAISTAIASRRTVTQTLRAID
jgi:Na+/H+ antiporter NhaD/arsenite permease-like protein